MTYQLVITRPAQKELAEIAKPQRERIRTAIKALAENPRPEGCRKLAIRPGWRIRVGDYRIIYEIDDAEQVVTVQSVGHRRDVYR